MPRAPAASLAVALAALALQFAVTPASVAHGAEPAMVELPIRSISTYYFEEEGGSAHWEYLSSGWLHFSGQASGRGYRPPMLDGWYLLPRADAQAIFDQAARAVALGQLARPDAARAQRDGSTTSVRLGDGRSLELSVAVGIHATPAVKLRRVAKEPKDAAQDRLRGRHLASIPALRVLEGAVDGASALTPEDAAIVVDALARDQRGGLVATGRAQRILPRLPDAALAPIAKLLRGPRPAWLSPTDLIDAIGAHGAAARPQVPAIAAAAVDDGSLAAAGKALAAIGGDEAADLLAKSIVPRLAAPPREPALQLHYRLAFARALRAIDTPQAREALSGKVFPAIRAGLTDHGAIGLGHAHQALAIFAGLPEERTLRDDLERLRTDPDPATRRWAEQALEPARTP